LAFLVILQKPFALLGVNAEMPLNYGTCLHANGNHVQSARDLCFRFSAALFPRKKTTLECM
ncbi:MAG: hypothetical protein VXY07_16910, partial [Planctomycetota bacterium]|nr:hypothetical protein [Planctomycetota bacterium]